MQNLSVSLAPHAQKDLERLPPETARKITKDLHILEKAPWPAPPKVKKLTGYPYWRLRTGDYRSFFIREGDTVIILRIVNRKDAEKTLKKI